MGEDALSAGANGKRLLYLFILTIPYFMQYIIPLSLCMSAALLFGSMSRQHETTAIENTGISPLESTFPATFITLLMGVLLFYNMGWLRPLSINKGERAIKKTIVDAITKGLKSDSTFGLRFNSTFILRNKKNTFLSVSSQKGHNIFVSGMLKDLKKEHNTLILHFKDGNIFSLNKRLLKGSFNNVKIGIPFSINQGGMKYTSFIEGIDLPRAFKAYKRSKTPFMGIVIYRDFFTPIAVILLFFIALQKSWSLKNNFPSAYGYVSIVLVILYFWAQRYMEHLAISDRISPLLAETIPVSMLFFIYLSGLWIERR